MEKDTTVQDKKKQIIDANQPTGELLTSRVGLAPKSILLINENHVFNILHCEGRPVEL